LIYTRLDTVKNSKYIRFQVPAMPKCLIYEDGRDMLLQVE
jgi:hypothetical protein